MATDYDAPRKNDTDEEESLEGLKEIAAKENQTPIEIDENDLGAESMELPGADLSNLSLEIRVVPIQKDEFTCSRCFIVQHKSQRASGTDQAPICVDCD
ncbi:MAG: DUF4193 domain-containing protein [Candidatus Nanopelagicales bacterium]